MHRAQQGEMPETGGGVGKASDDIKAVASLITDDVEDEGLARAFSGLGLIGAV